MKMTRGIFEIFFLITNFYVLKLSHNNNNNNNTIIKKMVGAYSLKIKIKKERTVFVDLVALCGYSNCVLKCG